MTASSPLPEATTRARILDAALDLFARHGFAGTSVRQLARAVGLRESSLYNHFASKEAIYHALIDARRSGRCATGPPPSAGSMRPSSWSSGAIRASSASRS